MAEEGGDLALVEVQVEVLDGHLAVGVDLAEVADGDADLELLRLGLHVLGEVHAQLDLGEAALGEGGVQHVAGLGAEPVGFREEEVPGVKKVENEGQKELSLGGLITSLEGLLGEKKMGHSIVWLICRANEFPAG